jgi:hypothetical protein
MFGGAFHTYQNLFKPAGLLAAQQQSATTLLISSLVAVDIPVGRHIASVAV